MALIEPGRTANNTIPNSTRNTTKSSRAVSVAAAAIQGEPNTPAMMATSRKGMAHRGVVAAHSAGDL